MRKNYGAQPYLYPMPVFIIAAYNGDGGIDIMNAAWGGTASNSKISMCLSPGHATVKSILKTGAFTVSMGDVANLVACDYVGIVSANDEPNKFEKSGFHATKSEFVDAPIIDELKMTLECKLASYDEETHLMIGEVVNVSADESVLNENGMVDPAKLAPITFDPMNHTYIALGEVVGKAFEDGTKIK